MLSFRQRLNPSRAYGMVSRRGKTEAGTAGTQPARDRLVEASKRRGGRRDRASWPPIASPGFCSLVNHQSSRWFRQAVGHIPTTALPRISQPPFSLMRAMPPKIPGCGAEPRVPDSLPSGGLDRQTTPRSVPRCCVSRGVDGGHTAEWSGDRRVPPDIGHP